MSVASSTSPVQSEIPPSLDKPCVEKVKLGADSWRQAVALHPDEIAISPSGKKHGSPSLFMKFHWV